MKCMHVQEKAVSLEFSTVVISGIHWGSENVGNGGLLHSIVGYHISRSYFIFIAFTHPPPLPLATTNLSSESMRLEVFFRVHIQVRPHSISVFCLTYLHLAYNPQLYSCCHKWQDFLFIAK